MTAIGASALMRGPALRSLQRELVTAHDEKIARVLAFVDALKVRGEADKLIAPLRGRLAELRPKRNLSLFRLLFMPLDPLIVAGPRWTAGAPSIPRTALLPLAQQVESGLGAAAATLSKAVEQHTCDEVAVFVEIGAQLWPRAAEILGAAPLPGGWTAASGLQARDHAVLAPAMAALLAQALPLLRIVCRGTSGIAPDADELRALLEAVAPAGPLPLAMMIAMALGWLPRSDLLIRVADDFAARQGDPIMRAAGDRAVDFALDGVEQSPLGANVASAAQDVRRAVMMLADIDLCSGQRPARRDRIERIRRGVDAACRERFASEIEAQLVAPSVDLAAAGSEAIATLETTARDLRRFETTARQIGGGEQYDQQLRRAAEALRPVAGEDAGPRIGRIRLVEILQGPDAAMAMLDAAPA